MPARVVRGPNGRKIRLADLPLVVFTLDCGCRNRDYAVQTGDLLFCAKHGAHATVVTSRS